ncbi:hypothetical protein HYALB_00004272 [Hymenoscyphus albidus]|uniref:DUF7702 domain-containing protein n=1 Tax=Hymenoscyphus albidus TaxID=595503 RepID=A0A9N9Q672_9HELO|nr:hypothetical protein HYALB_00004272 [Hymenoscyphus albidus]
MGLTFHQGIAAAEVAIYIPGLLIASFLTYRHGFSRSAGWYFLIIFILARVLGGAFQLATINDPTNISLLTGASILANIGFSPLALATLGLLSRLVDNIHKTRPSLHFGFNTTWIKMIETLLTIGLILGIVGGVDTGEVATKSPTGSAQPGSISKAGVILFIIAYVATILVTLITSLSISAAEQGERRILFAIGFSLPFLLVRLVYSCTAIFTNDRKFSLLSGSAVILLCVALIPELIVVLLYESVGLTLRVIPKEQRRQHAPVGSVSSAGAGYVVEGQTQQWAPKRDNVVLRIAKRTIIGRIVMALIPDTRQRNLDSEMTVGQYYRK